MAIKLSGSISRKIPIDSVPYSSQSFSAGMEVEINSTDAATIQTQLAQLYANLSQGIDAQIAATTQQPAPTAAAPYRNGSAPVVHQTTPMQHTFNGNGNGNGGVPAPSPVATQASSSQNGYVGRNRIAGSKSTGLLLMIVPDYVLADPDVGLATAVERDYELLGLWRYPEPEYQEFKQCVLLARRRDKALNKTKLTFPRWASEPSKWPVLRDDMKPVATLHPVTKVPTLRRTRLGNDVIIDTLSRSPLRAGLLREAASPAPPIGRPLLPLKAGHLALVLAGGLADGVIESGKERFLLKGTLQSAVRRISTMDQLDDRGVKTAEVDTYRTRYEMAVRCLRSDGTIENYTSAEPVAEEMDSSTHVLDAD